MIPTKKKSTADQRVEAAHKKAATGNGWMNEGGGEAAAGARPHKRAGLAKRRKESSQGVSRLFREPWKNMNKIHMDLI